MDATQSVIPSTEQWRNQLQNSNPLQLYAGNEELKYGYTHKLQAMYSGMSVSGATLIIISGLNLTTNVIGQNTTHYKESTLLPKWNYYAVPNSSLTVWQNVGTAVDGYVNARIDLPLSKMQCTLSITPLFSYARQPYCTENNYANVKSYAPALNFKLQSDFSRTFRVSMSYGNRYIYSKDSGANGDDKTLNLNGAIDLHIEKLFKYFYSSIIYNVVHYRSLSERFENNTNNVMNMVVGCKLMKNNMDISFACYDIFNRSSNFKSMVMNNYVLNTYNRRLARFYTVNIGFKLYKSKSGLSKPENILMKDGSINQK